MTYLAKPRGAAEQMPPPSPARGRFFLECCAIRDLPMADTDPCLERAGGIQWDLACMCWAPGCVPWSCVAMQRCARLRQPLHRREGSRSAARSNVRTALPCGCLVGAVCPWGGGPNSIRALTVLRVGHVGFLQPFWAWAVLKPLQHEWKGTAKAHGSLLGVLTADRVLPAGTQHPRASSSILVPARGW